MMDRPPGWPINCRDLKQEVDRTGGKALLPPFDGDRFGPEHHARWLAEAHATLSRVHALA